MWFGVTGVPDACGHFRLACNWIPEKQPMGGEAEAEGGASPCRQIALVSLNSS